MTLKNAYLFEAGYMRGGCNFPLRISVDIAAWRLSLQGGMVLPRATLHLGALCHTCTEAASARLCKVNPTMQNCSRFHLSDAAT